MKEKGLKELKNRRNSAKLNDNVICYGGKEVVILWR